MTYCGFGLTNNMNFCIIAMEDHPTPGATKGFLRLWSLGVEAHIDLGMRSFMPAKKDLTRASP